MKKVLFLILFCISVLGALSGQEINSLEQKKVVILTIPKSGTNLIHAAVGMISQKPVRQIGSTAFKYDSIDYESDIVDIYHFYPEFSWIKETLVSKAKVIIMIRDPRDILVSRVHWVSEHLELWPCLSSLNFQERVQTLLSIPGYAMHQPALEWMQRTDVFICRFEDLVGPQGGGSRARQRQTIRGLANYMGYVISPSRIGYIADHLFGVNEIRGSGTFRKGQIGQWKDCFGPIEKDLFKERWGQDLIDMGYAQDYDW